MLRHPDYTRTRIRQLAERLQNKIYPHRIAVTDLQVSTAVERISYEDAQNLAYRPVQLGEQFGPLWATYWFKAQVAVPEEWAGQRVDLLWVSHSEATLWQGGHSLQGLNHEPVSWDHSVRPDALLLEKARGGETLDFQIEMACNRVMGEGMSAPYKTVSKFVLDQCDIALFDSEAWELYFDLAVLQMLEAESVSGARDFDLSLAGELLAELNRFANVFDPDDKSTWDAGRAILKPLYERHNGTRTHELSTIGHAHIDTAWLWPLAETYRKCVRSFSSQVSYMERYPDFKFACSQAQQYAWIKERNPDLYARIEKQIKRGQWVPVGGTWIEPDCNIPSGEALARQFLYGQRFFQQEFGFTCREFWNPDVFGYNGQLPQIMRQSGITRFLTQKLSWNRFNKPHHHTFDWQGIDGSKVLTHFPPADNYNALVGYGGKNEITWLRDNARLYKDHDRSRHSYMLFGYGDGGGGPTPRMLEVLKRAEDLQGVPRTKMRSSEEFFDLLEADCTDRITMVGELYFEYHRGTYTTQAKTKKGNLKGEFLLHDVEFLATLAARQNGFTYPKEELDRLWKLLLLNQFHDILPGSSITLVYEDAERDYAEIQAAGGQLREAALKALSNRTAATAPLNTIGFTRLEVATNPAGEFVFVEAPSYGIGEITEAPDMVRVSHENGRVTLENALLRAVLSEDGSLLSLIEKGSRRESLSSGANVFEIYDDHPTDFDAWDIDPFHLETRQECPPATSCEIVTQSPLRAEVAFERAIGAGSTLKQTVRLDAAAKRLEFHTHVAWHESQKILKVAFPLDVHAMNATYEMQFGHVERPTHYTTPYDLAKYEVPGHKWADLSEHGFGVALLTESKYGFSTYGNTMRLSLLRAPKDPDPQADIGEHDFVYALMPHAGSWREAGVVAEGYRFNAPLLWANAAPQSFASCDDANLVLDTIKQAEDSKAIVIRLYECHGARGTARVRLALPFKNAVFCNILEEEGETATIVDGAIEVPYRPFQIISLKLM